MEITDKVRDKIKKTTNNMVSKTRVPHGFTMDADRFIRLFWTPSEIEQVEVAKKLLYLANVRDVSRTMEHTVDITHPCEPITIRKEVTFFVSANGAKAFLWPKDMEFCSTADPEAKVELANLMADIVKDAANRRLLDEVMDYVVDNCKHHEQARFIFPPYQGILRRAGYDEIAQKVATIKRAPSPMERPVPGLMRSKIKHVITQMTVHEMLGTFDGASSGRYSKTTVSLSLAESATFLTGNEDIPRIGLLV